MTKEQKRKEIETMQEEIVAVLRVTLGKDIYTIARQINRKISVWLYEALLTDKRIIFNNGYYFLKRGVR